MDHESSHTVEGESEETQDNKGQAEDEGLGIDEEALRVGPRQSVLSPESEDQGEWECNAKFRMAEPNISSAPCTGERAR